MVKKITKKPVTVKKGSKQLKLPKLIADLVAKGRTRGFVTQDEILELFSDAERHVDELDQLYDQLFKADIDVFESVMAGQNVPEGDREDSAAEAGRGNNVGPEERSGRQKSEGQTDSVQPAFGGFDRQEIHGEGDELFGSDPGRQQGFDPGGGKI